MKFHWEKYQDSIVLTMHYICKYVVLWLQEFYAKCCTTSFSVSASKCLKSSEKNKILVFPLWGLSSTQWKARRCDCKAAESV